MTPFGIHDGQSLSAMTQAAVNEALGDAGVAANSLEVAFFGSATTGALQGQHMVPGQLALRDMGIQRIPVFNVENACATGASAFALATTQLRAGTADIAIAVGAEKMNIGDRARSFSVFDGAYDVSKPQLLQETLDQLGGSLDEPALGARSIFMDIYAAMARSHMRLYGTTQEQIAAVAAKNHAHAQHNPRAHFRNPMSVEAILAARPLPFPLTVPMCAPVTDGAAAVILCTDAGARRLRIDSPRLVRILASEVGTGSDRDITTTDGHLSTRISDRAYDYASIDPSEVSVAEVHDATAFGEVLQTETLGLVARGEGGKAAAEGATTLGGQIPVNPSGGLESKGHPIGATGLGQIFELVQQLRGNAGRRQVEGARIGLAENGGGFHHGEEAVTAVTLLSGAL